jgi:hypothetical protein
MADGEKKRLHAELEKIERDAMLDQRGWMAFLDGQSGEGRKAALSIVLQRPLFEQWCVLTDALS